MQILEVPPVSCHKHHCVLIQDIIFTKIYAVSPIINPLLEIRIAIIVVSTSIFIRGCATFKKNSIKAYIMVILNLYQDHLHESLVPSYYWI